ncbi:hypothetical protein [Christiangramia sp. SM2212]|uniref:MukB N-terminal domain-containing protein n=1 Tax=Christiangramia sediminicola TaxID=3073267 RepID=A0ABU1ETD0_9FLAO|nr:hypothetical protein [Christiangramia sp. SM2212]MDR5591659.1 hypothetical protein [Christiangramia sp. SM2212]
MNYPRIYSLSTVGVIKHYNQDYLLHNVRTDFTGSNGIGKSIIADLIQLIFITDKDKIVFGTDSLKKDKRLISTLPYHTSDAYVFMNIEFKKDQFITIGVNIPNKKSRPLKSFWALNKAYKIEDNIDISELVIPKQKLLTFKDFIKNDEIPDIEKLMVNLREDKGVYLKHFTFKEQKLDFYKFLYDKKIMPINLANEDNLKTFAKIIQSFSKAKTLDTDNDSSLKDFLFENDNELFQNQYETHKKDLEKLISDYKVLDNLIIELNRKQKDLTNLKVLEEKLNEHKLTYFTLKYCDSKQERFRIEKVKKYLEEKLGADRKRFDTLKKSLKEENKEALKITKKLENSNLLLGKMLEYEEIVEEMSDLNKEVTTLSKIQIPKLKNETKYSVTVNIEDYHTSEIKRRIDHFTPIYLQYASLSEIYKKIEKQSNAIAKAKNDFAEKTSAIKNTIELLSLNKKDSLFSKLLNEGNELTEGQETILFNLLSTALTKKPNDISSGTLVVENTTVLNTKNIEYDKVNNGYWFKTGQLSQFVQKTKSKRMFQDKETLVAAAKHKKDELREELEHINLKLSNIEAFEKGQPYEENIVNDYLKKADDKIKDYSAFNELKLCAGIIQNLSKKLKSLNNSIEEKEKNLAKITLKKSLGITQNNISDKVIEQNNAIQFLKETQSTLTTKILKDSTEQQMLEKYIPRQEGDLEKTKTEFESATSTLQSDLDKLKKHYPDFDIESLKKSETNQNDLNSLEEKYSKANVNFVTDYRSTVRSYPDIEEDVEIKEQLENSMFSFKVLERILLGASVGYLDNIPESLNESNRQRFSMMDSIYEAMLKIFKHTRGRYDHYETTIADLNTFFKGKKIGGKYYFQIKFKPLQSFSIDWVNALQSSSQKVYQEGQLPFGNSVEQFVEDFFQKATNYSERIKMADLLNPKSYFELDTKFTDNNNVEKPGSTGESYAAIVLLGIGRLSIVEEKKRPGIRFLILEEISNLDRTNFNAFPDIAKEFGYQIITMTPKPYGSDSTDGWYLYHLIEGKDNPEINYPTPNSFFKTNENKEDLKTYLESTNN